MFRTVDENESMSGIVVTDLVSIISKSEKCMDRTTHHYECICHVAFDNGLGIEAATPSPECAPHIKRGSKVLLRRISSESNINFIIEELLDESNSGIET